MICTPCARAADNAPTGLGHHPEICRDFAIQPAGCACAHKPVAAVERVEAWQADHFTQVPQSAGRDGDG
jgi:hypothetical protein